MILNLNNYISEEQHKCEANRNNCISAIQNMVMIASRQFKNHQKEK